MQLNLDVFINKVIVQTRIHDIFDIADDDMEEYMVWPDTTTVPQNWDGWCLEIINNNNVPVACP